MRFDIGESVEVCLELSSTHLGVNKDLVLNFITGLAVNVILTRK